MFNIYRRSSDLYVQKGRMILWSFGKWTFIQLRSFCRQRWLLYGSQKRARQVGNKIASEKMLVKNKTKYIVAFLTYVYGSLKKTKSFVILEGSRNFYFCEHSFEYYFFYWRILFVSIMILFVV